MEMIFVLIMSLCSYHAQDLVFFSQRPLLETTIAIHICGGIDDRE